MDYSSLFLPAYIVTLVMDYDYDLWFTPNKIYTNLTHLCLASHSMYNISGPLLGHSSHHETVATKSHLPSLWLYLFVALFPGTHTNKALSLSVPCLSLTYSQSLSSFSYIFFPPSDVDHNLWNMGPIRFSGARWLGINAWLPFAS